MDKFCSRALSLTCCVDAAQVNTKLQYIKLEKIEVGGTKGKVLTTSVAQIYVDFLRAIAKFDHITVSTAQHSAAYALAGKV